MLQGLRGRRGLTAAYPQQPPLPAACLMALLCRDERYGWAIEEKLERKIYNFPFKPVIHVTNIDVI